MVRKCGGGLVWNEGKKDNLEYNPSERGGGCLFLFVCNFGNCYTKLE